jgi:membrane-bound serine protease (ClpP class)
VIPGALAGAARNVTAIVFVLSQTPSTALPRPSGSTTVRFMKTFFAWLLVVLAASAAEVNAPAAASGKIVYVLPIRDDIMPPLTYVVRRGVKEAIAAKADLLVLDMKTNGGRLDTTEDIIEILGEFKGDTVCFVNDRAFSAGAFIAVATKKIYMAPSSVIGAATPIMLGPDGVKEMPQSVEAKMTSAVRALVRRVAQRNGHNPEVVEAMIDRNKELKIGDTVINPKGEVLTLTDTEAAKEYATTNGPAKPLLSSGTVASLEALTSKLGYANARRIDIKPTGAERLGTWIQAISPVLLIIGIICMYIEFKTPGFGAPGIISIAAFAIYFAGSYIAGFSGLEWMLVFIVGVTLLALEFFVLPGTMALGVAGAGLMVLGIVMALIDLYPGTPSTPGMPSLPRFGAPSRDSLEYAIRTLLITFAGSAIAIWLASKWLPKTSMYAALVSQGASGAATTARLEQQETKLIGLTGVTISALRPGGKAQFGDDILDVMSQGDMLSKGTAVRIVAVSGGTAVVERT